MASPIVYYVSSHGHGHSVRTCDIILQLQQLRPDIPLVIRSMMSPCFFETRLEGLNYRIESADFDVGLVQIDSIRADLDASYSKLSQLLDNRAANIEGESDWIAASDASLVVSDIPGIPIAAAAVAGVPSIAVGNFSWDWIYSEFAESDPRWKPFVDAFAEDYSKADLLIRLPFSCPMDAFPRHIDVGLLASPGQDRRPEIARSLGADPSRKWVLMCFSSIDLSSEAIARIGTLNEYEFLAMPALQSYARNMHDIRNTSLPFSDLVASVDYVLSKPGYGIISDCVANAKPLVHSERSRFREYGVLLDSIEKYLRHAALSMDELYSGNLSSALENIECAPEPLETPADDGAVKAAWTMLNHLENTV